MTQMRTTVLTALILGMLYAGGLTASENLFRQDICLGAPTKELPDCAARERATVETTLATLIADGQQRLPAKHYSQLKKSHDAWLNARAAYCDLVHATRVDLYRGNLDLCLAMETQSRVRALTGIAQCENENGCWKTQPASGQAKTDATSTRGR